MRSHSPTGILFAIFGLIIAFGPQYVFTPCIPEPPAMPMRCWWTARMEIGIGLAIAFGGFLLLFRTAPPFRLGIAAMVLALAALAAATPLVLIGVCKSPDMHCRLAMFPAQIIAAAITALTAIIVCFRARGKA